MAAVGTVYILDLMGTFFGVFLPTALFNLAWMVRAIQGSLATADPVYEEAAMTLGASRLHAFFSITLPHIAPGLIVGAMIVFTNSATAFIAPLFVGRWVRVRIVVQTTATGNRRRQIGQLRARLVHGVIPAMVRAVRDEVDDVALVPAMGEAKRDPGVDAVLRPELRGNLCPGPPRRSERPRSE